VRLATRPGRPLPSALTTILQPICYPCHTSPPWSPNPRHPCFRICPSSTEQLRWGGSLSLLRTTHPLQASQQTTLYQKCYQSLVLPPWVGSSPLRAFALAASIPPTDTQCSHGSSSSQPCLMEAPPQSPHPQRCLLLLFPDGRNNDLTCTGWGNQSVSAHTPVALCCPPPCAL
jgi:hypothetical protein